jgi:hypothetical protein
VGLSAEVWRSSGLANLSTGQAILSRGGIHALLEKSKNNLLVAREQLHIVHEVLSKDEITNLAPKDKRSLSQACQRVTAIFSEEHGTAVKGSEVD